MDQGDGTFAPLSAELEADLRKLETQHIQKQTEARLGELEKMAQAARQRAYPKVFAVGEEVVIRESRFRVETIGTDLLVLRLLPEVQEDSRHG